MVIKKSFEDFRSIISNDEKRMKLFSNDSYNHWANPLYWLLDLSFEEITVEMLEKERIDLAFIFDDFELFNYKVEFSKSRLEDNIEINVPHPLYHLLFNFYIKYTINKNWNIITTT